MNLKKYYKYIMVIISHEHKFIFIKGYKVAGSSVELLLENFLLG